MYYIIFILITTVVGTVCRTIPEIYPEFARVGHLLLLFHGEHLAPVLQQAGTELRVLLVDRGAELYHSRYIRHLELTLHQGLGELPDVLGEVQSVHLLQQLRLLSLAEGFTLPDEGRVLLQTAVQLVQMLVIVRSIGRRVLVLFPEIILPLNTCSSLLNK